MPGPGLNQHDQLDKDEWFSTRGYFFPAASGSLQNWPLSPVGSVSPTSCALFLLNLDLDLILDLDLNLDLNLDLSLALWLLKVFLKHEVLFLKLLAEMDCPLTFY